MDTTSPPIAETVRTNVRVVLARRGMTGPQLAAAIEVAPHWVSRRLNGTTAVDLSDLALIAEGLDVTPAELVTPGSDQ